MQRVRPLSQIARCLCVMSEQHAPGPPSSRGPGSLQFLTALFSLCLPLWGTACGVVISHWCYGCDAFPGACLQPRAARNRLLSACLRVRVAAAIATALSAF